MSDIMLDPSKKQIFPVVYPGMGQFLDGQTESSAAGAKATIEIPVSNNPVMITGVRVKNIYTVPEDFQNSLNLAYLARLDGEQTIQTTLTQQNIIVRPTLQSLVTGGGTAFEGTPAHWHPFESPYPFRGGNNIDFEVQRLTSYPEEIVSVVCYVAVVGWIYMSDAAPAKGPPSSGYPVS